MTKKSNTDPAENGGNMFLTLFLLFCFGAIVYRAITEEGYKPPRIDLARGEYVLEKLDCSSGEIKVRNRCTQERFQAKIRLEQVSEGVNFCPRDKRTLVVDNDGYYGFVESEAFCSYWGRDP